ncbi:MAG: hypothetical protein P3X23_001580 [Thermosynechococcus sp. Uc]|nr:hypothetical protein [Thermosynechococcus sp. Uc]MDM7325797.1 hypothetical protein [Thermosynechococcus sp. Uc]HIK26344.1 hypothetical protein [Thermosynechococcus sp. M46_R2017_013]
MTVLVAAGITVIALAQGYVSDRPVSRDQLLSLWNKLKPLTGNCNNSQN